MRSQACAGGCWLTCWALVASAHCATSGRAFNLPLSSDPSLSPCWRQERHGGCVGGNKDEGIMKSPLMGAQRWIAMGRVCLPGAWWGMRISCGIIHYSPLPPPVSYTITLACSPHSSLRNKRLFESPAPSTLTHPPAPPGTALQTTGCIQWQTAPGVLPSLARSSREDRAPRPVYPKQSYDRKKE